MSGAKVILILALFFSSIALSGQTQQEKEAKEEKTKGADWNEWNFRVGPYFWFINLNGEIVRPPQPPAIEQPVYVPPKMSVDVGFSEIRSSIKFAGMLSGVYRNKLLITQFQFTGIVLESSAITPNEFLIQNSEIRLSYFNGDFEAGYRLLKKKKLELDLLAGLKLAYFKIGVVTELLGKKTLSGERDKFWMDPIIATNFLYQPWKRWEFVVYGDWGPDFFDKDYTYQYMTGVNFLISRRFFTTLGYRDHFLELPNEEATYNGRIKGLFFRIGVQF